MLPLPLGIWHVLQKVGKKHFWFRSEAKILFPANALAASLTSRRFTCKTQTSSKFRQNTYGTHCRTSAALRLQLCYARLDALRRPNNSTPKQHGIIFHHRNDFWRRWQNQFCVA